MLSIDYVIVIVLIEVVSFGSVFQLDRLFRFFAWFSSIFFWKRPVCVIIYLISNSACWIYLKSSWFSRVIDWIKPPCGRLRCFYRLVTPSLRFCVFPCLFSFFRWVFTGIRSFWGGCWSFYFVSVDYFGHFCRLGAKKPVFLCRRGLPSWTVLGGSGKSH